MGSDSDFIDTEDYDGVGDGRGGTVPLDGDLNVVSQTRRTPSTDSTERMDRACRGEDVTWGDTGMSDLAVIVLIALGIIVVLLIVGRI